MDIRNRDTLLKRLAVGLGHFAAEHALPVLGVILIATVALVPFAINVGYDDDVLKFLPEGDPSVERFQDIGERFHGLQIALIGVETNGDHLFTVEQLASIRRLTRNLAQVEGVGMASSLTELQDITERVEPSGETITITSMLVGELPDSEQAEGASAEMAALKERVMSRDHIVGSFISHDARSTMILCRLQSDGSVKPITDRIRSLVEDDLAAHGHPIRVHYGGAPFIGAYVSDGAQADIINLSPFVCAAVILIILLTARSLAGVVVALGSVGVGIVWVMGVQALVDQPLTLVSSSLPVLLVALGSAYSIHMLTSVLSKLDAGATSRKAAVRESVTEVAPPIFVAGLTSALGFLSFLVMDIAPMRDFGLLMFVGTFLIVILALLVVPAACVLLPLKSRAEGRAPDWAIAALAAGARAVSRRPLPVAIVLLALVAVAAYFTTRVETHMDTKNLFKDGAEPVLAEQFFEEKLGGASFLQVEVRGDIKDPLVLRQIERYGEVARGQEGVTDVQSVADVVILASGLAGEKRIPLSDKSTGAIATLIDTDPNLRLIVTPDWTSALIQIKLGGFDTRHAVALGAHLEEVATRLAGTRVTVQRSNLNDAARKAERAEVIHHVESLFEAAGESIDPAKLEAAMSQADGALDPKVLGDKVAQLLNREIVDDELVYLEDGVEVSALVEPVSKLLVADTLTPEAFFAEIQKVANAEELEDLDALRKTSDYLHTNVAAIAKDEKKRMKAGLILSVLPESSSPELRTDVERALSVLEDPVAILPAEAAAGLPVQRSTQLDIEVSGYPMVYAGMNESVSRNQTYSLIVAGILVLLALAWFFRSPVLAIAAGVPAGLTLLFIFGIMGALEIRMDVGTSMIASIGLGVGIDYAVHLVWRHGVPAPEDADATLVESLSETGWGIIINALEVTAGFAILAFGTIVPMQNFGLLTASAMIVSAFATLLLVPALIRWLAKPAHVIDKAVSTPIT